MALQFWMGGLSNYVREDYKDLILIIVLNKLSLNCLYKNIIPKSLDKILFIMYSTDYTYIYLYKRHLGKYRLRLVVLEYLVHRQHGARLRLNDSLISNDGVKTNIKIIILLADRDSNKQAKRCFTSLL